MKLSTVLFHYGSALELLLPHRCKFQVSEIEISSSLDKLIVLSLLLDIIGTKNVILFRLENLITLKTVSNILET